jgi:FKBP-type peptidyl-prolyl cis-trans isomerase
MKKLSALLALPVLLSACGAPAVSNSITSTDTEPTMTTNDSKLTTVTELKIEDEVVGTGAEAKAGDTVEVNYLGTLTDGTKFDSSYDRNQTFKFTLGAGEVIEGWDKGFAGMKVGGKRKLTIPSDMAYGDSGISGAIPGGATLVFEVELVSVK